LAYLRRIATARGGFDMDWTSLLKSEIEAAYASAESLLAFVEDNNLGWKPAAGENWMTMGQLLKHVSDACGSSCKGFVTGDWGPPQGDESFPTAEKMPAVASVAEARKLLAEDKQVALAMVAQAGEQRLAEENATVSWAPGEKKLGYWLLLMVQHLNSHKSQLFYYLKLRGKPVNTGHLWKI
jgi:uncharacterized damage-inducible protein DinB